MKNLKDMIKSRRFVAKKDLELLDELAEDHQAKDLDPDRLDQMYVELMRHEAIFIVVESILNSHPDPRSTKEWRESSEGKALERARNEAIGRAGR